MNAPGGTNEHIIRAARAFSNRAIADQDIDAISSLWRADVLVLTSTSVQLLGAQANRRYYEAQFARRPDTVWVRTPSSVGAPSSWQIAHEEGDWTGQWTEPDGRVELRGRYMAQWVRAEGEWRIQGEIYVPISRALDQGAVHV